MVAALGHDVKRAWPGRQAPPACRQMLWWKSSKSGAQT